MTSQTEILDCLQLMNTDHIGPKTFFSLVEHYGSIAEAAQNLPPRYHLCDRAKAETELKKAQKSGVEIIPYTSPLYPQSLLTITDFPPLLYAKGKIELLNTTPALAIVGARNASINGRKFASHLAYDLTEQNVMIISGMARGIDASAHLGSLHAHNRQGSTIAVLGTGVDIPYPLENQELYERICDQGCVVSELPLGTTPQASNFPRRNRIISGLSNGVLVIEANLHSGSLITANTAAEQGRDVFAVPGSPLDGRALGTNKLIKDGAYLVESAEDVLDILHQSYTYTTPKQFQPHPVSDDLFTTPLDNEIKTDNIPDNEKSPSLVLSYISTDGVEIDEIIQASGLDSATVNSELLYLEMEGKIYRQPGNKVALIK